MVELFRFESEEGHGIVLNMETLVSCWSGLNPGTIVFVLLGQDHPISVKGDFDKFVQDYMGGYDCRVVPAPPAKKKSRSHPKRKKRDLSKVEVVSET